MAARFTQAAVTRAIKGAQAAGLVVEAVEIDVDGTIRIVTPDGMSKFNARRGERPGSAGTGWDRVLEWRDDDV